MSETPPETDLARLAMEVDLEIISNAVLRRLIAEIRQEAMEDELAPLYGYSRTHNRHNRGGGSPYNRTHNRHNRGVSPRPWDGHIVPATPPTEPPVEAGEEEA